VQVDLKQMVAKNLHRLLPFKGVDQDRVFLQLVHCQIVKKFFVLELQYPADRDPKLKTPLLNQNDYVILFR
jgi:hypothetical protein